MTDWRTRTHRRHNPLTGEWVLVSPHRTDRPWLGETAKSSREAIPRYDPKCYLCPGNERANGRRNPHYDSAFVFENDFAALLPDGDETLHEDGELFVAQGERGNCRVLCFSPRHDLHLSSLPQEAIERVVDAWAQQYAQLSALDYVRAVTIFENHGAMMGASNPHPHCQIWAESSIPNEQATEAAQLRAYRERHGSCLLCDYAAAEERTGERVVFRNAAWLAVVPFWAVWPFELLLLPRAHRGSLDALDLQERAQLASALADIVGRFERVFDAPFPYSMGFHQRAAGGESHDESHLHAHYYPPLLRSATVRKYMVGYEMLGQPQRDLTPEDAAERLRHV